jgi:hypothetical protein
VNASVRNGSARARRIYFEVVEEQALMADPKLRAGAAKVQVIQNDWLECRAKCSMGKEDDAEAELLSRAGAMHADLIVGVGFEHGEGGTQPTRVWGTAIKFK